MLWHSSPNAAAIAECLEIHRSALTFLSPVYTVQRIRTYLHSYVEMAHKRESLDWSTFLFSLSFLTFVLI